MISSIIEWAVSHCCLTAIGLPFSIFLLYQLYQAIWARYRITRLPKDCYILITGCGRGFGREAAIRLDRLGCHVFAGCRSERGLKELDDVTSERCRVFQMDVTNTESIKSAYELVRAALPKGQGLWGLVNNAGIAGTSIGLPEWTKPADYEECMKVNVYGIVDVTRTFLPLVKACQGRILMVSSMYGRVSYPVATPYAVSKYATEAISDGLRRSLRPYGCKVILIEPGVHRTNITADENLKDALRKGWEDLSQEERDEYGENYLEEFTKYVLKFFKFPNMNSVATVAEVMESALFCQYPKARYPVGNDSKWVFVPMTYMPEWLVDWLIDTVMRPPIPAVVLKRKKEKNQ